MPRDGRKPNEQDILIAGAYNLGFLGLRAGAAATFVLDWWAERLETDCIVDPERGFFVDQRWMDLVPGMVGDVHLIRDPGFNVAYWNLPARTVAERDGAVHGRRLAAPALPLQRLQADTAARALTHQNRIRLADDPVLAALCDEYAQALRAAGYVEASKWPYSYADDRVGHAARPDPAAGYCATASRRASVTRAPFDEPRASASSSPGCGRAGGARCGRHGVTRYLGGVHQARTDLPTAYPDLDDAEVGGRLPRLGRRRSAPASSACPTPLHPGCRCTRADRDAPAAPTASTSRAT